MSERGAEEEEVGKKGGSRHLKRLAAPPFWPIGVKEYKWTTRPSSGPHPTKRSIPLLILVRDVFHHAKTAHEARAIIKEGRVKVDGRVRKDRKFSVGLMDVVEVGDESFRILPHPKRGLMPHGIGAEEKGFKVCQVVGKTILGGGNLQLNMHDGTNILVRTKDPTRTFEDSYGLFDSLKLSIPDHDILGHIRLGEKAYVMVIGGRNTGRHGKVAKVEPRKIGKPIVTIRTVDGESFHSINDHVFCIGEERPWISLPK